ncbi:hypothetical protein V8C40DRAFT_138247 [Trichoderma camerunense]
MRRKMGPSLPSIPIIPLAVFLAPVPAQWAARYPVRTRVSDGTASTLLPPDYHLPMVAALGKDSLPSSLEPGSENDAPSLAFASLGHCLRVPLGGWWRWDVIARAVADAHTHALRSCSVCPALFADMFPPDRRVARPWYYYWIPTEWYIANRGPALRAVILLHAPPFKRRGRTG